MVKGYPDFHVPSRIIAVDVSSLPVDIIAQSLDKLGVDLKAQSLGNLLVDVAAQSLSSLRADTVSLRGKLVNVADVLRGYMEAKFYLIGSWRDNELRSLLVDKVVRNVVDFHTLLTTSSTYAKLLEDYYAALVKRNITVGGMWSIGLKVGYWVSGGNGQFKVTSALVKERGGVHTTLASSYYESDTFNNTSEVVMNVNLNNEVDDTDIDEGDHLEVYLCVEAKNDSGNYTYVRVYMDPREDEAVTLIPLRSVAYE